MSGTRLAAFEYTISIISQKPYEVCSIIPKQLTEKWTLSEVKEVAKGHAANKSNQALNPGQFDSEAHSTVPGYLL